MIKERSGFIGNRANILKIVRAEWANPAYEEGR